MSAKQEARGFFGPYRPSGQAVDIVDRALRVGVDSRFVSTNVTHAIEAAQATGRKKVGLFGDSEGPLGILKEEVTRRENQLR